jgi:hypothetical protein
MRRIFETAALGDGGGVEGRLNVSQKTLVFAPALLDRFIHQLARNLN